MKSIEHLFSDIYLPQKALIVYSHKQNSDVYVEAYDMDDRGRPVNAHPLTVEESAALSKALDSSEVLQKQFLDSKGLLPENVLYLNSQSGFAMWHTPPQQVNLLFKKDLGIPCGKAYIPALLWKAGKETLELFALKGKDKPKAGTSLYNAPFFNLYPDGRVCMGTVDIEFETDCSLEEFIGNWQDYFFNSYFSHMIQGGHAASVNIIGLWREQIKSGEPFPEDVLIQSPVTIKNLIR